MTSVVAVTPKARMIEERAALHEKCVALGNYILSPKFSSLSPAMQNLLERQLNVMDEYDRILGERLSGAVS